MFTGIILGAVAISSVILLSLVKWVLSLRTVVPSNYVHVVQRSHETVPYGVGQASGNVYYNWPEWLPLIGLKAIYLPVSNFELSLDEYEAYDLDRVPFLVDITAFFRINDTALASQRVSSFNDLYQQLEYIVQGAVRTILAANPVDVIMSGRSKFGDAFTEEVASQLKSWGVETVKSIELMDIKDTKSSAVIHNIMAKKQSFIEMESRKEIAENMRAAETAEVEATRDVAIQKEAAQQAVGERQAEKDKAVGVAQQVSIQEIKAQQKITTEREMAVRRVNEVQTAQITKESQLIKAEEDKQRMITLADGKLEETRRLAEGIKTEGEARADAEKAMQLAPVSAQIELAQEIGQNEGYQTFLVNKEKIAAQQAVGIAQAKALEVADIKIIANSGDVQSGVTNVMDMFTAKGGTNLAAMAEAFLQSPAGSAVASRFGVGQAPSDQA